MASLKHNTMPHVDVLHVIGAFAAGGAERFVVDLVRALSTFSLSVGVLVLSSRRDAAGKKMASALEDAGIPYLCGPTGPVGIRSAFWYLNQMRRIRPLIVHLHTQNTEVAHYLARKLYTRKHAIFRTIHNTNIPPVRLHWIAIHGNPAVLSIACSEPVRAQFEAIISGKMVTIRNGINFDWPIKTTETQARCRKLLVLEPRYYHFINVARMGGDTLGDAAKGHDVLIKAWRHVRLGKQGGVLNLIGDGNLREQLECLADNDPSIIFHGVSDNVHEWLVAADCFVMPSRYEGLPIAAIEAIGTGLPCVFTDIPPLRELNVSEAAWADVDDVQQLAEAMQTMLARRPHVPEHTTSEFRSQYGIESTALAYRTYYLASGFI